MRVLHTINDLRIGGTQELAVNVVAGLRSAGVDASLCVLGDQEGCHPRYLELLGERVTFLGFRGDYRRPLEAARLVRALSRHIRARRPMILHSYLWLSDVATAASNQLARAPHVVHLVDRREWMCSRRARHRFRRSVTRGLLRRSARSFFAVSEATRRFAVAGLGLQEEAVSVVPNSIDPVRFAGLAPAPEWLAGKRPAVLGVAGRLVGEKGHAVLFDALRKLGSEGIHPRLLLSGDGPLRESLERIVRSAGLERQVSFLGWVAEIRELLERVDVVVVPSVAAEGLPTVILEAMSAGRLVVASDVGGAGEVIAHGQNGLLVPAGDSTALADAIRASLRGVAGLREMTTNARRTIEEGFSTPSMIDQIQGHYARLLHPAEAAA